MKKNKKLEIRLIKSLIGRKPKHKLIANQLGLRKMHTKVSHNDTPTIRGMISQIDYLLQVEEKTS